MATFRQPPSGDVWQDINAFRWITGPIGDNLKTADFGNEHKAAVEDFGSLVREIATAKKHVTE